MRTTIELTRDVANKFLDKKLEPFDFNYMPFERFDIQMPYEVFQSVEEILESTLKHMPIRKPLNTNQRKLWMEKCQHIANQLITLHVHKKNRELAMQLSFMGEVMLDAYMPVEPFYPFPIVTKCTCHSKPLPFTLNVFGLIVHTMHFFNEPKVIKVSTQEKIDKKTGARTYTTNKKKYVYNTRYIFKNAQEYLEKRVYNIHTESWEQRGHYRTYKSGKRVWIKPCTKTRGKGEIRSHGKQYRITQA